MKMGEQISQKCGERDLKRVVQIGRANLKEGVQTRESKFQNGSARREERISEWESEIQNGRAKTGERISKWESKKSNDEESKFDFGRAKQIKEHICLVSCQRWFAHCAELGVAGQRESKNRSVGPPQKFALPCSLAPL